MKIVLIGIGLMAALCLLAALVLELAERWYYHKIGLDKPKGK